MCILKKKKDKLREKHRSVISEREERCVCVYIYMYDILAVWVWRFLQVYFVLFFVLFYILQIF